MTTIKLQLQPVTIPNVPKSWHPVARRLFNSLKTSGQSDRFQDSDWAYAYMICEEISDYKKEQDDSSAAAARANEWYELDEFERKERGFDPKRPPHVPKGGSAMKLTALIDALGRLAMTEVDRLKVRIELTEPEPDVVDAEVVAIDRWQKRLEG